MNLIKVEDGLARKYSLNQLITDNPTVSFSARPNLDSLADYSVYPYENPQKPSIDPAIEKVIDGGIQEVDGQWVQVWTVEQKTTEEQAQYLNAVRSKMVVTMRQARLALLQVGKLADVETAIAGMAEPEKSQVSIEWEYASTVERLSPWVAALAPALQMTETELDQLFEIAEGL